MILSRYKSLIFVIIILIVLLSSFKPSAGLEKNEDPGAGLMQMMQKMYEDGDDDMKRTIRKAWHESQEKKMKGEDF